LSAIRGPGRHRQRGGGGTWRLWLASALLAALVILTFISLLTPYVRVCTVEAPAPTCRPLELADPPVLLAVLLVLVIVFPDIKTLELPGGLKFERNVIQPGEDLPARRETVDQKASEFERSLGREGGQNG
jgi:hypothetical protein